MNNHHIAVNQPEFAPLFAPFDPTNCQTYSGICHCGTVQYTVTLSPPLLDQKVVSCNCSICTRNGYLLVYPLRSSLQVKRGEDSLRSYSFGRKRNMHMFCSRCGSAMWFDPRMVEFGESPDIMGVNVRMLKGVKFDTLQIVNVDGWNEWEFIDSDHLQ